MHNFFEGQRVKEINSGRIYTVAFATNCTVEVEESLIRFHPAKLQAC